MQLPTILVIFELAEVLSLECYKETCVSLAGDECFIKSNATPTIKCSTNEKYCMVSFSESSCKRIFVKELI